MLCIRPENARLGGESAADENIAEGRITFAAYLGNAVRYDIELAPNLVFKLDIRDPWHHELLPTGAAVTVRFPAGTTVAVSEAP